MVARLAHAIEAEGYAVWWDAELPPHQSYGDVITDKIAQARAALVVWSDEAVKSEWVRAEADMARNQRKLIQTALGNVMPPLPFNQIQFAEMGDWQGEADHPGWRKVKRSLAELCGPGTAASDLEVRKPAPVPPRAPEPDPPHIVVPPAPAAPAASKWPLFAGVGIALVALAVVAGVLLGRQSAPTGAPTAAPATTETAAPAPQAVASAPAPVVTAAAPAGDALPVDEDGVPVEPDPADMEIADSSTRLVTAAEIAGYGPTTLKIARNEIFARKGRRFKDPWLTEWFSRYAWYKPRFDDVPLNAIEQQNVALIKQAEARYGQ